MHTPRVQEVTVRGIGDTLEESLDGLFCALDVTLLGLDLGNQEVGAINGLRRNDEVRNSTNIKPEPRQPYLSRLIR